MVQLLAGSRLFHGIDPKALEGLVQELPAQTAAPGQRVVQEGEVAGSMFIVLGGELEVLKKGQNGDETRLAFLGPGDWFGEMAVLDVQPRSASIVAVAPSLLLRLSEVDVDRLLYRREVAQYARFMRNLARELSRRLRVADGLLASATDLAREYSKHAQ